MSWCPLLVRPSNISGSPMNEVCIVIYGAGNLFNTLLCQGVVHLFNTLLCQGVVQLFNQCCEYGSEDPFNTVL